MNHIHKLYVAVISAVVTFFMLAQPISAQVTPVWLYSGELVTIGPSEVINQNMAFFGGETVEILGTINGDVYVAGGQVMIGGTINGDLFVAGGDVNLNGTVTQDVRLAAGQLNLDGTIGRNATFAAGNISMSQSATIQGSVLSFSGNQNYQGTVGGDIITFAGNTVISNQVNGNVDAVGESLRISPSAIIAGDLTYNENANIQIDEAAQVNGEVIPQAPINIHMDTPNKEEVAQVFAAIGLFFTTVSFVSALILGLLLHRLAPIYMAQTAKGISQAPFKNLGIGFVTLFLTPVLAVVLMASVFGFPLGLLTFVVFFVGLYFAKLYVATALGQIIAKAVKWQTSKYLEFLIGLVVLYILFIIPVIGTIVQFLTLLFGLGALVLSKSVVYQTARDKKII